jgi:hypothetical protein
MAFTLSGRGSAKGQPNAPPCEWVIRIDGLI